MVFPPPETDGTPKRPDEYRYGSFSFADEEEDPYFVTHKKPEGLEIVKSRADEFIKFQCAQNRPVVLVTSGGSTVPLEACRFPIVAANDVESNSEVYWQF